SVGQSSGRRAEKSVNRGIGARRSGPLAGDRSKPQSSAQTKRLWTCRSDCRSFDVRVEIRLSQTPKGDISNVGHGDGQGQQGLTAGTMPKEKLLVEMGKFNGELVKPASCWPLMASSPARKANAFGSRETSGP